MLSGASIAIYVARRNARILEQILDRTLLTETFHLIGRRELFWAVTVNFLLCVTILTLSSYLAHRQFHKLVSSPVRLWELIGAMGVVAGSLLAIAATQIDFYVRGRIYGDSNLTDNLLPILKLTIVAFVAVLLLNYLYGTALKIAARLYGELNGKPASDPADLSKYEKDVDP